ncbi:MAG TPA: serine/threonine-protein kinase [Chloroflexota bacterium]|jgi:serine/threonine-protein kinase|nr:serine/threonine-protein kinase [Chloroflexota bacterium]
MRLSPGQRLDNFEVLDVLAQGGMSESYRAKDCGSGRTVVLKVPLAELLGDLATYGRYEREVAIGNRLHHPNIQQVLGGGRLPGTPSPYIVLEYVEGAPFRHYLNEHLPLPVADAVEFASQVASAMADCHSAGVVHRDLKPENILITPDKQLKLLDFGIASLQGARRLTWGPLSEAVGTPDYMAPEQIRGERGGIRTDVYALGMMLFEMLAGRMPYQGDNSLAIMAQHVNVDAPRVRIFRPEVSPELDAIVARAIRRDPKQRFDSMAELEAVLQDPSSIELAEYQWDDEAKPWAGFDHQVGAMPSAKRAVALIVGTFAVLALLGFLAQFAHGAAR